MAEVATLDVGFGCTRQRSWTYACAWLTAASGSRVSDEWQDQSITDARSLGGLRTLPRITRAGISHSSSRWTIRPSVPWPHFK